MRKLNIKNYKAILFDLFHTLVSLKHSNPPGKETSEILGVDKTEWNNALFNKTDDRLRGKITDAFKIIKSIAILIKPDISDDKIAEASISRMKRFEYAIINISKNTLDTIKKIKNQGFKIGLVSNADKMEITGWHKSEISKYFDNATFSCDIGYIKPEKEIYLNCINALKIKPHECLFIGDGGCNELLGAKKLKIDTVFTSEFIKDLWQEKIDEMKKKADYHITNINELL